MLYSIRRYKNIFVKKINVICVQETFSEIESWQNLWTSSGGCESSWNCGVRASRGVGILLYDIVASSVVDRGFWAYIVM